MSKRDRSSYCRPIRAITFDLDDTLWDIWSIIERAEWRLHDWLAHHYPRIPAMFTPVELRQLSLEVAAAQPHLAHDRSHLRKEALRLAARRADCKLFPADAAFQVFHAARNDVEFFDDVLPALERLSCRYTLGALTNGNADIHAAGLGELLAFSINAVDAGAGKPDPAIFEAACQRLGLVPEQIVHVGDDPELDILAAARVGFRTVWVNRGGKDWPHDERADAEIATLRELEALLAEWEMGQP